MDLRDIQGLHAQFAPDSMTIDLPRQLAALPAPADVGARDKMPTMKVRLPKAAPAVRRTLVAVAIAAVVGMAGMGAASLYKSFGATSVHGASPRSGSSAGNFAASAEPGGPATRPIDAEPPHPVAVAPMLTAKDFAPSSVGLTADQFRNSLSVTSAAAVSPTAAAKPNAPLSNDEQRAAASPIHPTRRAPEAVTQVTREAAASTTTKPAAAAVAVTSAPTAPVASVAPAQSAAQPSTNEHASSSSAASARPHDYRHHSRSREERASDNDGTAASNKKAAPATRTGSNEVQMF